MTETPIMHDKPNDILLLAGKILTFLMQGALAVGGAVIAIIIPLVLFFQDTITTEIAADNPDVIGAFPAFPIAGLLALVAIIIVLLFKFFGKLRAIISTVGEQDPFVPENAERLNLMAWLLLGVHAISIPLTALAVWVAAWFDEIEDANFTVDGGLDLTGILMVIVLFILARVFKHGASMREDLEGTV